MEAVHVELPQVEIGSLDVSRRSVPLTEKSEENPNTKSEEGGKSPDDYDKLKSPNYMLVSPDEYDRLKPEEASEERSEENLEEDEKTEEN